MVTLRFVPIGTVSTIAPTVDLREMIVKPEESRAAVALREDRALPTAQGAPDRVATRGGWRPASCDLTVACRLAGCDVALRPQAYGQTTREAP